MAFRNHPVDECRIWRRDINRSFTFVVAGDEECRTEPEALQDIQEVTCKGVRTIVKGQSNNVLFYAVKNVVGVGD